MLFAFESSYLQRDTISLQRRIGTVGFAEVIRLNPEYTGDAPHIYGCGAEGRVSNL
jgi:hypothetical protein